MQKHTDYLQRSLFIFKPREMATYTQEGADQSEERKEGRMEGKDTCVTKLTCMRGFTVGTEPLRFRRIKVTGKNQQGHKCRSPCLIYHHSAWENKKGERSCQLRWSVTAKVTLLLLLRDRSGKEVFKLTKNSQKSEETEGRPSFTLRIFTFGE